MMTCPNSQANKSFDTDTQRPYAARPSNQFTPRGPRPLRAGQLKRWESYSIMTPALQKISIVAYGLVILAGCPLAFADEPWRSSDAVMIQACFDRLPGDPPATLRVDQIEHGSTAGYHLNLIGFTTTKRPVYQGAIGHPSKFSAVLVYLPGTQVSSVVKRPADLSKSIDLWRSAEAGTCTKDDHAQFRILRGQDPASIVECPDVGMDLRMKVAASAENALSFMHFKQRGPTEFNNLRGCREFIHK